MRLNAARLALALLLFYSSHPVNASALVLSPGDIVIGYNGLTRVDPVTGSLTQISSQTFRRFDVSRDGLVYGVSQTGVSVVDPSTGVTTTLATGFTNAGAVAVGPTGRVFVYDQVALPGDDYSGTASIIEVDPQTGQKTTLSSGGFLSASFTPNGCCSPRDLEIGIDGDLFVLDAATHDIAEIFRVDLDTGAQSTLGAGVWTHESNWNNLGIAADGSLLLSMYLSYDDGILIVDSDTGAKSQLTGSELVNWGDIAGDAAGNILIAALGIGDTLPGGGGLYRIDPATPEFAEWDLLLFGTVGDVQLVPIPEPSTALLIGLGLAGLALRRQ